MLKHFFSFLLLVTFVQIGKCSQIDTAYIFYKYDKVGYYKVEQREQCDFFVMITSPDEGDSTYKVKEFYRDGHIKLTGKALPKIANSDGLIALEGDCVNYFETGVRQSIVHYSNGYKEGNEYLFYPNGKKYALMKNPLMKGIYGHSKSWECHNSNGEMICKDGNGKWVVYDPGFKNIILEGLIKNGERDGEWRGGLARSDSIKYTCVYKSGSLKSSVGYDKNGKAYPFKNDVEPAHYYSGPFYFLKSLKNNTILPKGSNGKKISADSVIISFVVEKDGQVSNFETLGEVTPDLKIAIKTALYKCKDWTPRKNFGVPVRAKVMFSMKYLSIHGNNNEIIDAINYSEKQIGDNN